MSIISLKNKESRINIIINIIIVFLSSFVYFYIIPKYIKDVKVKYGLKPNFMPIFCVISIFLFSILHLCYVLKNPESNENKITAIGSWTKPKQVQSFWVSLLIIVYLFFLINFLGFYSSTFIFLISIFIFLGEHNYWLIIITPIVTEIIIYFLLVKIFHIYLPTGIFF